MMVNGRFSGLNLLNQFFRLVNTVGNRRDVYKRQIESTPDTITTPLKLLKIRMAVRDGKIMRLEISMAPIILIPITIVTAVKTAIRTL